MARPKNTHDSFSRFGQVLRHFLPALSKEKPLIAGAMVALFSSVTFRLLEPWPLKFILDLLIPNKAPRTNGLFPALNNLEPNAILILAPLSLVVVVALCATSDYFKTVGFALLGNRVMTRIRGKLYRHLQALSLSFHDKARSGDLLVRIIGDIKLMRDVAVTALLPLMASVLILVGMFTVMFILNWQLTLLSLAVMPLFGLSTVRLGKRIHAAARKQRQREGAMAATASEAINSVKVVQALSLEDHFESSFSSQNKRSLSEGVKTRRLAARLERTADILIAIATAAVMGYGAKLVLDNQLTAGDLVVFLTYMKRGFRPLQDFAKYAGRLAKAAAAGERIVELLDQTPDIQDAPDAIDAPPLEGKVEFAHVDFEYEEDVPTTSDLSLTIKPGQYAVIAGDSGAGKSTLLSLMLRLYDPQQGVISIDGTDIRDWTLPSLRGQISVVLQDTILFAADVSENIALGASDVDQEQIEAAARLANAHEFIKNLPQGYDTVLGERGVNLSQGQRQRIAIARAAVRNAPILLLDEPTVGLDENNERSVRDALRRLARGRTTLLVTHDLRQTMDADVIFFIADGCISESGTHQQLLKENGTFAQLYRSQTGDPQAAPQGTPHSVTS